MLNNSHNNNAKGEFHPCHLMIILRHEKSWPEWKTEKIMFVSTKKYIDMPNLPPSKFFLLLGSKFLSFSTWNHSSIQKSQTSKFFMRTKSELSQNVNGLSVSLLRCTNKIAEMALLSWKNALLQSSFLNFTTAATLKDLKINFKYFQNNAHYFPMILKCIHLAIHSLGK